MEDQVAELLLELLCELCIEVVFDLVPDASEGPINIRLYLKCQGQPMSETWLYQWTPPPAEKRRV